MSHLLPYGCQLLPLTSHRDERGVFTEIHRACWTPTIAPCQWNLVESAARVLRGVHVHGDHYDYLLLLRGQACFGLRDLRVGSPTQGLVSMIEADGEELQALVIPPGVAHGFYFPRPSLHAYAVSHYWNPLDELGCRFDDPELGITWPDPNPTLSERDKTLPPLAVLLRSLEAWRPADPWKN